MDAGASGGRSINDGVGRGFAECRRSVFGAVFCARFA